MMRNLELKPLPLSTWRKIALGTWKNVGDPSVYGVLELDATKIVERQKRLTQMTGQKPPTITAIVGRAVALTLHHHPQINGMIRWGKIYNRSHVTLFLQTAVDEKGADLSGVVIDRAEHKSLGEIMSELKEKAKAIREQRDPNFKQAKATFKHLPAFLSRWALNIVSFLIYGLNIDMSWAGLPRDPFGSVMITSIGSLGLDEAFAPIVPYSRVPLLLAIGVIRDTPVARNGQLAIAPMFKICATFDHRFVDGIHGAKMAKHVRRLLETDEGLDEIGL